MTLYAEMPLILITDKNFLFVAWSIFGGLLCVKNIMPQDMGCCMDDPAEGIWQHSFYGEIYTPFGLFSRQVGQMNRKPDKSLQHALFFKCVVTSGLDVIIPRIFGVAVNNVSVWLDLKISSGVFDVWRVMDFGRRP